MAVRVSEPGTTVAFLSAEHSWVLGQVDGHDAKTNTYTCSSNEPEKVTQKVKNDEKHFFACRPEFLEEDVDDLLTLTELHEASLLFCLKRRYFRDVVYTNIGPIVVAINPFTFDIPWYKDEQMSEYLKEGVVVERQLPHSWAVAHNTYYEMRENRQNQTILISGESGAGKTEGAKIVVKYLGELSTMHGTLEQQSQCHSVTRKVNAASPILEAFGNAKTVRNDNSSRFGKFMRIQFDPEGFMVGSHSTKYLLEKSRIITSSKGERVYHSFYQLAAGKQNGVRSAALHKSLNAGECTSITGHDDAEGFAECLTAFGDVGISEDEQGAVWRVVAGILFYQNVEFTEAETSNGRVASIDLDWKSALERACSLWGVDAAVMERELLSTTRVTRGETVQQFMDKTKATDTRDAVSKALYSCLFDWLVDRINVTTNNEKMCSQWVGLLDIFGFEDFQTNSFEQLCINLANETLQNHYNYFVFTEDMRECKEEGIDTTMVTFEDNMPCIDLLAGGRISIFSLLDDECKVGSGTDDNFMRKIIAEFMTTKQKEGSPYFASVTGKMKDHAFRIKHYAGDVQYVVDGFLEKNRDTLKDGMKTILSSSEVPLIAGLVPPPDDSVRGGGGKVTVSAYFHRQLQDLMAVIKGTNPHWIRCIKPHPAKQPRMFSHLQVTQQLRSAGVLATVKIRQGGFPIRFKKELFVQRYRILVRPDDGDDVHKVCAALFRRLDVKPEHGQLGTTKVFLRQTAFLRINHAKDDATVAIAAKWQALCRGSTAREALFSLYVRRHRERLVAERKAREEAAKRAREEAERQRHAAEIERERIAAIERDRRSLAVVTVQRYVRGFLTRRAFTRHFIDSMRAQAERAQAHSVHFAWDQWSETDSALRALDRRLAEQRRTAVDSAALLAGFHGRGHHGHGAGAGRQLSAVAAEVAIKQANREALAVRRDARRKAIEDRQEHQKYMMEKKLSVEKERQRQRLAEAKSAKERASDKARIEKAQARDHALAAEVQTAVATAELRQQKRADHQAQKDRMREKLEAASMTRQERDEAVRTARNAASFRDVADDWDSQRQWGADRDRLFRRDAAAQIAEAHRVDAARDLAQGRLLPSFPNPGLSLANRLQDLAGRPVSELTGRPTTLSPRELESERRFRETRLRDPEVERAMRGYGNDNNSLRQQQGTKSNVAAAPAATASQQQSPPREVRQHSEPNPPSRPIYHRTSPSSGTAGRGEMRSDYASPGSGRSVHYAVPAASPGGHSSSTGTASTYHTYRHPPPRSHHDAVAHSAAGGGVNRPASSGLSGRGGAQSPGAGSGSFRSTAAMAAAAALKEREGKVEEQRRRLEALRQERSRYGTSGW